MAVLVRQTSADDEEAVSALLEKSYSQLLRSAYEPDVLKRALPLITRSRPELLTCGTYYVAETDGGEIIGAGGWTRTSPTGHGETASNGNIRHFGTDPEHTGKGIGRALMERSLADAAVAGLSELNCYSTLNGEGFYKACGFERVEPLTITLPGNVSFPSIRMTRVL